MNTYCNIDESGICETVIHTRRTDWETSPTCIIASGANVTWVGTKSWNGNAWNEYVPPIRIISKYAFVQRFSQAEFAAILAAAKTDVQVEAYWTMANCAVEIDLDDDNTGAGLDLLIAKGIIAAARKAEILA